MSIDNKFPGKDISSEDLLSKFPLAAKSDASQKTLVDVRGAVFGSDVIPTMCGPNTVESLDLILDCARHASSLGCSFLRGGAYKPLTFPYIGAISTLNRVLAGVKWFRRQKLKLIFALLLKLFTNPILMR